MILVHSRLSINHTKHFPWKNLKKRRDKDKKGVTKQVYFQEYFQEYFVQRDVGRIGLMVLYSDLSVIFNSVLLSLAMILTWGRSERVDMHLKNMVRHIIYYINLPHVSEEKQPATAPRHLSSFPQISRGHDETAKMCMMLLQLSNRSHRFQSLLFDPTLLICSTSSGW